MQGQDPVLRLMLVNAIGGGVERFYDVEQITMPQEGDLLMLSTDGLHDKLKKKKYPQLAHKIALRLNQPTCCKWP